MRAPNEVRPEDLRGAHDAAHMLIGERFRIYLPGRMLPILLEKFRDDTAEFPIKELPPLPQRSGSVKVGKPDDLTSSELDMLSDSVAVLMAWLTALMEGLLLLRLPREFRDALVIEKPDRPRIADELRGKAKVP